MQDLGLHDMHVYLPGLKYKPPSLMLHRYRVLLFAIQSLLNFSDSSAHLSLLYAISPLKYKCSAHLRLFTTIIALIGYQV